VNAGRYRHSIGKIVCFVKIVFRHQHPGVNQLQFFYSMENGKNQELYETEEEKQKGCLTLNTKPFFYLTILSYKILNIEQSIVHTVQKTVLL